MATDKAKQAETRASEARAVVALAAVTAAPPPRPHRQALFLAQLIATKQQHPQTRARRRADPADAARAYRAMAKLAQWG